MKKKEILETLKEMLADYEVALIADLEISDFEDYLKLKNLDYGFCSWICKSLNFSALHKIMEELEKDYAGKTREDGFLYPTSWDYNGIDRIKKYAVLPRAKNIKRTIERIEKEILEDITVIMPQQI